MGRKTCDTDGRGRRGRPKKHKEENVVRTGFDGHANAPWRKTVSIFKQPVTLVATSHRDTKKAPGGDQMKKIRIQTTEKPFQALWAKRLETLQSCVPTLMADKVDVDQVDYLGESLHLAGRIVPATKVLDEHATTASLLSVIHNPNQPGAFGQLVTKEQVDVDAFAMANHEQAMCEKITITGDDITSQEKRVLDARKRLTEVLKHFG